MQRQEPSSTTTREFSEKGIEYSPGCCSTTKLINDINIDKIHFAAYDSEKLIVCYNECIIDIWDLADPIKPLLTHRLTGITSAPDTFCFTKNKLIIAIGNTLAYWNLNNMRAVARTPSAKISPRRNRSTSLSFPLKRSSEKIPSVKPKTNSAELTPRRFFSSRSSSPDEEKSSPLNISNTFKSGGPTQTYLAGDDQKIKHILVLDDENFITVHQQGLVRFWNGHATFYHHEIQLKGDILACNLSIEKGNPIFAVREQDHICIYHFEEWNTAFKNQKKNSVTTHLDEKFFVQQTLYHCSIDKVLLTPSAKLMVYYTNPKNKECHCLHVQDKSKPKPAQLINRAVDAINEHDYKIMPCGELVIWLSNQTKKGQPLEIMM